MTAQISSDRLSRKEADIRKLAGILFVGLAVLYLNSCGGGAGAPGSTGAEETNVFWEETVITPTDSGTETDEVDVSEIECPSPEVSPKLRDHRADVTFSAHRINPSKEIFNPQKIESYSIEYIPLTPGSPDLPDFTEGTLSPAVSITVLETGETEEGEATGLTLMSAGMKQTYIETGKADIDRQYKAVYTFKGKDSAENQFTFGGVGQAEVVFTIGRFGRCEEDLTPPDEPPPPPTNPTIDVISNISPGEVKLTWEAPLTPTGEPVTDLKGYKIYRNSIPIVDVLLEPTTSFTDSDLTADIYNYQVSSVDDADHESTRADFEQVIIETP